MKIATHRLTSLVLTLLVLCYSGTPAIGQQAQRTAHVKVPFEFWVGDTPLSAGDYQLRHVLSPTLVVFTSKQTKIATEAYMLPVDDEPVKESEAKLVFSVNNGRHSLYEVDGVFGTRVMTAQYGSPKPTGDNRVEVPMAYY